MIRTRFAPEPNGYLHLGHVKSMYYNFEYPFKKNIQKECYLRLDNTNPKTEKIEYETRIIKDVIWMGYKPDKITFTSDYFHKIYELTIKLINDGNAYVDFSSPEEIKKLRSENKESPFRNKSVKENLRDFDNMKNGKYNEFEAVLRLKIDKKDRTNDCMKDPIAYRIINTPHYKTGEEWKIYPSYEYSHYIVDSLEGITHSFCTLEFYLRRNLSYWVCNKIGLECPEIIETNRLQTDFGILSKRTIKKLIDEKQLTNWDDPRLLTIYSLKNKGITSDILKLFCSKLDYSLNNNSKVLLNVFENSIREKLNCEAPRRMIVEEPLKITILNYSEDLSKVNKPIYPHKKLNSDYFSTDFNKIVYIEKTDFKADNYNSKYKRLAPNRTVRLKYAGLIKYISHDTDKDNNIINVNVEYFKEGEIKDKIYGTIHWVSYKNNEDKLNNTYKCEYFSYPNETDTNGIYYSKTILIDSGFKDFKNMNFQMERIGYFKVNNKNKNLIKICSLKENKNK